MVLDRCVSGLNPPNALLLKVKFCGILTSCIAHSVHEREKMDISPSAATPHKDELCVVAFRITHELVIDAMNFRRDFKECYEQVIASLRQRRGLESIAKA